MTDKVQKIREEVERLMKELIQEKEKGFGSDTDDACILELQNVLTCIDSMQEESVSKGLEEGMQHNAPNNIGIDDLLYWRNGFITGAKWKDKQITQLTKQARLSSGWDGFYYGQGYQQAEKDLELTWEDTLEIFRIAEQLKTSWWFRDNEQTKKIGTQLFWEEVLNQFKKEKRNEKDYTISTYRLDDGRMRSKES